MVGAQGRTRPAAIRSLISWQIAEINFSIPNPQLLITTPQTQDGRPVRSGRAAWRLTDHMRSSQVTGDVPGRVLVGKFNFETQR